MAQVLTFTFYYCTTHDDGCCSLQDIQHVNTCGVDPNEHCTICEKGVIEFDGQTVRIVKSVTINYSRYGGGFKFDTYTRNIRDQHGNDLQIPEVTNWILANVPGRNYVY